MERSKECEFDTHFGCDFEVEFKTLPDEIDCVFCHFTSLEHTMHQTVDMLGRRARLSLKEARYVMMGLCLFDRKIASSIKWLKSIIQRSGSVSRNYMRSKGKRRRRKQKNIEGCRKSSSNT